MRTTGRRSVETVRSYIDDAELFTDPPRNTSDCEWWRSCSAFSAIAPAATTALLPASSTRVADTTGNAEPTDRASGQRPAPRSPTLALSRPDGLGRP